MLYIIIWDEDVQRIQRIEKNMQIALSTMGVRAIVMNNSEPPMLARMGLYGRTPAIQVTDRTFFLKSRTEPTFEDIEILLRKHIDIDTNQK